MAPIARDSWTLSSSVFTVHEVCTPCPPVIFESPIRSRAADSTTDATEDCAFAPESHIIPLSPLRLESRFDSVLEESPEEPSSDDTLTKKQDRVTTKRGASSTKTAKKGLKNRHRKPPNRSKKLKKTTLSKFDELMLKLEAVDGPQLVLQVTKLEDMSSEEVEANWRSS